MLIYQILSFCSLLIEVYSFVLVACALMSWFPGADQTWIGQFIIRICQPYLKLFDRLNLRVGPIDLTIIVAIFALNIVGDGLLRVIQSLI